MKLLDLFWFFLDGDKSSSQIIAVKRQQKPEQKQQHQHETEEAIAAEVDDFESEEMFDEFFHE